MQIAAEQINFILLYSDFEISHHLYVLLPLLPCNDVCPLPMFTTGQRDFEVAIELESFQMGCCRKVKGCQVLSPRAMFIQESDGSHWKPFLHFCTGDGMI